MADRDYYSVLGVSRNATKDEIRSAHRKLARELHPDVNKSPDASEKFAAVQEAYDILSDDEKRKVYDRVGHEAYAAGVRNGAPGGGGGWGAARPGRGGTYTWTNVGGGAHADPFNQEDVGSIFEELFGVRPGPAGRARGARHGPARPQRGADLEHEITIPFDLALIGGKHGVTLQRASGDTETIEVTIPRGLSDGAKLRLRGKGEQGRGGAGDLLLRIRVAPHPRYRREGLDLYADLPVSIVEASLGSKVDVETPRGAVEVSVPAGAASGSKLRLRGRGVETAKGEKGDFFAVLKIVPFKPDSLSEEDRGALRRMGERLPGPRD